MGRYKRRITDRQDELLDRIYAAANTTGKLADRRQLRLFINEYYRNVSEEDVEQQSETSLANAALAHLQFAFRLPPGEHRLRIYNPTTENDGWQSEQTVIELVHENMPFLVDSVGMTLGRLGYAIELTVHPLLRCVRTPKGQFQRVRRRDAGASDHIESFIRMEIRRESRPDRLEEIAIAIEETLRDVRAAVTDWGAMRDCMQQAIARLDQHNATTDGEPNESTQLLRWLADDRFTFLGYREYKLDNRTSPPSLRPVKGSGLGVNGPGLRKGHTTKLSPAMQRFQRSPDTLLITKANTRSTVHRGSYLDYIGIKTFDKAGVAIGEQRFVGLLTSQAYSELPRNIPLISSKIDDILERAGVDRSGHRGKALVHILNTYPRDELFQASTSDLLRTATGILNLQDRRRVKLFMRRDTFRRFFSCIVFIPRDKYNTEVRERCEAILTAALDANSIESSVQLSDSTLARVHLLVYINPTESRKVSIRRIESDIETAIITWRDRLRTALQEFSGDERGADLFEQYGRVFPLAYEEDNDAVQTCHDIVAVDRQLNATQAQSGRDWQLHISAAPQTAHHFRVFCRSTPIALSDALPLLENLGARVLSERPYQLRLANEKFWIQDFELTFASEISTRALARCAGEFARNFKDQLDGSAEADGYNRLIVTAALSGRSVVLIRSFAKYLLQLGIPFSPTYLEALLCEHAAALTLLTDWFAARLDASTKSSNRTIATLQRKINTAILGANSLDADRALRALFSAMRATVRTNFFTAATQDLATAAVAMKIETRNVEEAPLPRPAHEIFVYSPRVEGVHLRAGDVARGGLRWSDRPEDFRTEVLGLMKAQTVKNTVIVPTGAKGGFFPKHLPDGDRDAIQAEVTACYTIFIRALLSLTDNIVNGDIVAPDGVVKLDPDDPYLVVAADKGTATFSDTANGIAVAQQFWLDDAFASGGSAGYDHKKMAITARGAWEAVKRHFREIGVDTQTDAFTVAGVGDMSGDVFGNGMLLSETIRLQAAFNHQHIFLDPEPDAAMSFAERQRLFALQRSGWGDYDTTTISAGGGIFPRSQKSIPLSAEVRRMLGVNEDALSPPQLIAAILRMQVDLLWNGGIGTYVKASSESHNEVGDRHNDGVRVDARALRCKVIGEGGNLGLSQLARVEFAQHGGKINTDFIDNSAGVDSSDREVNIKILLSLVAARHKQSRPARNRLLAKMTDEVAQGVLRNNYLQTQAISMMENRAVERLSEHRQLVAILERRDVLNRSLEFIPDEDGFAERKRAGLGLTRPEISVILSYAKLDLYQQLSLHELPLDDRQLQELIEYFPEPLQKKYPDLIGEHQLGSAIVTTLLTNSLVNRMGPAFAIRAADDTGYDVRAIAASYVIARHLSGARQLWADIEQLDTRIPANIQYAMMFEIARKLRHCCYWLLKTYDGQLDIEREIGTLSQRVLDVLNTLPDIASKKIARRLRMLKKEQERMGVPTRLANRVAAMHFVTDALEIVRLADQRNCRTDVIAQVYFGVAERLSFEWLRDAIDELKVDGRWQSRARGTLRDAAIRGQRDLTARIHELTQCRGGLRSVEALIAKDAANFERMQAVMNEMRDNKARDFATLTVAVDELTKLAAVKE